MCCKPKFEGMDALEKAIREKDGRMERILSAFNKKIITMEEAQEELLDMVWTTIKRNN